MNRCVSHPTHKQTLQPFPDKKMSLTRRLLLRLHLMNHFYSTFRLIASTNDDQCLVIPPHRHHRLESPDDQWRSVHRFVSPNTTYRRSFWTKYGVWATFLNTTVWEKRGSLKLPLPQCACPDLKFVNKWHPRSRSSTDPVIIGMQLLILLTHIQ